MKKKSLLLIGLFLAVIAVIAAGCESFSPPSTAKTTVSSGLSFSQQNTGIWVTGEGSVSVVPDIAILNLGVEVQSETVAVAQSQAATSMDAVVRELKSKGIADKDIKTRSFSIYPVRRWVEKEDREVLVGYRVNNMVTTRVKQVEDVGAIIDAVAEAGGDYIRINNISFTVDDPAKYREEAREKAMADAEAKAKQLAAAGGVNLGSPTYISESDGAIPVPRDFAVKAFAEAAAAPPTSISPGETEIRITVQVVYGIR